MTKTVTFLNTHQPTVFNLLDTEYFLTELSSKTNSLPSWLVFSFLLFLAGLLGIIFNFKNFIVTMMSVELMYLGVVTSFIIYSVVCQNPSGSIYGLLLLVLAACESAIGLGILIVLYRFGRSIDFLTFQNLGG
jgi:NADH-quinone oxidoreductase subunit K